MLLIKSRLRVVIMITMAITPSISKITPPTAFLPSPVHIHVTSRSELNMSQRSQSSLTKTQNKSRGANAANHNRRGHEFRINNKDSNRVRRKNSKRAPRWEREGDQLYAEVSKRISRGEVGEDEDDVLRTYFESMRDDPIVTVDDVHRFLKPWTMDDSLIKDEQSHVPTQEVIIQPPQESNDRSNASNLFLWGSLPVGPVLSSRLYASQRSSPTSVQKAAFSILTAGGGKNNNNSHQRTHTTRSNAIIASPTGTGKTLAYLLPLLCTSPGGQYGEGTGGVLIVTPTIELACQIQREVNVLWPPDEKRGGHSALFVVGDVDETTGTTQGDAGNDSDPSLIISPGRMILRSIPNSPIIAGTPKMLRMLYREAERIARYANIDRTILEEERITSKALLTNMRAIVLDEADRLLRTEAVAREAAERKERKIAQRMAEEAECDAPSKKKRLIIARDTQTELLLRDLPIPSLERVQIICASATVGRTMRRQLMQILDAPSADAAATLITGEDDARVKSKDSEKRKSVLLPEKLGHSYQVVDTMSMGDVTEELSEISVAEQTEERMIRATVKSLWDTMLSLEAKPILIFPGKIGVERIQRELRTFGLGDVRTLRNLDGTSPESPPSSCTSTSSNFWTSVPVYVIGERFARGLDLPNVEYVVILSPPSSAAGYAHMAGRTGRSGRRGTAITFLRPKNNEVKRLVAIAETLGVKFRYLL